MDISDIMVKMQEVRAKLEEQKAAARKQRYEGAAGGGMVKAVLDGDGKVVRVDIAREAINPDDAEMLGDLVAAAVNDAVAKVAAGKSEGLGALAGGLDLGGMAQSLGIDLSKLM